MEDWAEIRRLHRSEQMPIRAIARHLGISKNTVKKALADDEPPRYQRPAKGSIVDAVEPQVRELLREFPDMPSTVIRERIGWTRSRTVLFDRIAELRPLFRVPDPVSRTEYQPGELAQCDLWFPPVDIPVGFDQVARLPVLVMVSGYSRIITARMIPSRQGEDLLAGQWALLAGWGAVPKALVWDNESAIGSWRGGRPQLTEAMQGFRGALGIKVVQCRPRDPEAKGLVERVNGYLETSFLPGRSFTGPADFNTQLTDWLILANARRHRRARGAPGPALGQRPRRDAGVATGHARCWLAVLDPAGPGSLPALRRQRLLDPPAGHRAPRRPGRGPRAGRGHLRRCRGRPPPALLGAASEHHRPSPRRRGDPAALGAPRPGPPRARHKRRAP